MTNLLAAMAQAIGVVIVTVALVMSFGWIGLVVPGVALVFAGERWS